MKKFFIDENLFDYANHLMKTEDISKHIKIYPGSVKGPNPEDDPERYTEWFVNNQPTEFLFEKGQEPDYSDIGIKYKAVYKETFKKSEDQNDDTQKA
jgi:hypothetical protein